MGTNQRQDQNAIRGRARRGVRLLRINGLAAVLVPLLASLAAAQQAAPAPGGTTVTAAPARNLVVDAAIVIVMVGIALFAVCRSSRRN
jgi:hypothetical protein